MKKLNIVFGLAVLCLFTLSTYQVQAQRKKLSSSASSDESFGVGTKTLNIGIGVGREPFGSFDYNSYGTGFGFKVAGERGMWQAGPGVISLGAEIGASFSSSGYYNYKSSLFVIAARAAYHYGFNVPKLDVYAGPSLGPGIRSYDYGDFNTPGTHHDAIFTAGLFVGGSYYFTPRFGVNVEAGYDITLVQGGIIFKMN